MAGNHQDDVLRALEDCKMYYSQELIWVKNNHALSRLDHQQRHELCLYGWKGKHKWIGKFADSVYEYDKPLANKIHPTQKPVELIEEFIRESTKEDYIIYDPFAGSGTVLMASEKSNRISYSMEIDPLYVDATCQRYEALTGIKRVTA